MVRGYLPRLFLLAALWGSSYLFIKVGVDDLEPSVLMVGRTLLAGILLLDVRHRDAWGVARQGRARGD